MAHFSLYVYRDGTGDRKINKQKNNGVIIGAMIQKYTVCIMRKGWFGGFSRMEGQNGGSSEEKILSWDQNDKKSFFFSGGKGIPGRGKS